MKNLRWIAIMVLTFTLALGMTAIVSAQEDTTSDVCPDLMPTRLTINQEAQVMIADGPALSHRTNPGLASSLVGVLPNESVVTVVVGPECGPDGIVWWLVDYHGRQGWAAESDGQFYLLQPTGEFVAAPPAPDVPIAAEVCEGLMPTRLDLNQVAQVMIVGLALNQRADPGLDSSLVGVIPNLSVVTVVSGPECGPDSAVWWLVNYSERQGWVAESDGQFYLLQPAN
jgi:uncharacterized protein YraI